MFFVKRFLLEISILKTLFFEKETIAANFLVAF